MGRVFVAAKGNDGVSTPHYPSDYDGSWVISVGATDKLGRRVSTDLGYTWGSNYGNGIDVVAPGYSIYSTMPTYTTAEMSYYGLPQNYGYLDGTSMATPFVSGLAALIFSQDPNLHPEDVQGIIRASADDNNSSTYPGYDDYLGAGRINAGRALQYMLSPWTINHYTAIGGTAVSSTGTYGAYFYNTGGALATGGYIVKRYDVRNTVSFQFGDTTYVWGRGVNASTGWSAASPNYETGYCNVTSSGPTSAELQTYVYEVWDITGAYLGWFPTSPSNVQFAYTVLGKRYPLSVSISGPSELAFKEWGTWTAYPTGGSGNVSYQWYVSDDNGSTWSTLGTAQSQTYRMLFSDFIIRCDVHDNSTGENASARMTVYYYSGGIRKAADNNEKQIPTEYSIGSYPNPFNPAAVINYQLPVDGLVKLSVFDVLGREIKTIVNETKSAGYYKATFDGSQLPSGIYLARISVISNQGKSFIQTVKMVLTK